VFFVSTIRSCGQFNPFVLCIVFKGKISYNDFVVNVFLYDLAMVK
jgi:hypothetical protein